MHDFFNLICVAIMFPLELTTGFLRKTATALAGSFAHVGGIKFTSPIKLATQPAIHLIKDALTGSSLFPHKTAYMVMLAISIIMLFFALFFIVKLMKSLVIQKVENALDEMISRNALIGVLGGIFFTTIVQSSSITTSLLVPLIAAGILTIKGAFPIIIGANIGTTTTAILASFATGNISAVTIAFVHFLFNTVGAVIIYPIKAFRMIPMFLASSLGRLSSRKRRYVLLYVFTLFYLIPLILIMFSKICR